MPQTFILYNYMLYVAFKLHLLTEVTIEWNLLFNNAESRKKDCNSDPNPFFSPCRSKADPFFFSRVRSISLYSIFWSQSLNQGHSLNKALLNHPLLLGHTVLLHLCIPNRGASVGDVVFLPGRGRCQHYWRRPSKY